MHLCNTKKFSALPSFRAVRAREKFQHFEMLKPPTSGWEACTETCCCRSRQPLCCHGSGSISALKIGAYTYSNYVSVQVIFTDLSPNIPAGIYTQGQHMMQSRFAKENLNSSDAASLFHSFMCTRDKKFDSQCTSMEQRESCGINFTAVNLKMRTRCCLSERANWNIKKVCALYSHVHSWSFALQ